MRHLPDSWSRLDEEFRVKYSIKLRREAQRLLLLSRGVPVPPTKMLDTTWRDFSASRDELDQFFHELAPRGRADFSRQFPAYVSANLNRSHI